MTGRSPALLFLVGWVIMNHYGILKGYVAKHIIVFQLMPSARLGFFFMCRAQINPARFQFLPFR